jgi:hypothetical protein
VGTPGTSGTPPTLRLHGTCAAADDKAMRVQSLMSVELLLVNLPYFWFIIAIPLRQSSCYYGVESSS